MRDSGSSTEHMRDRGNATKQASGLLMMHFKGSFNPDQRIKYKVQLKEGY